MKMFIAGNWTEGTAVIPVLNPFNNQEIDTVPKANAGQIETALAYAEDGAKVVRKLPGYERYQILMRAAKLMAVHAGGHVPVTRTLPGAPGHCAVSRPRDER